jgi:intracellular septation protein
VPEHKKLHPTAKLILDFAPLALFFIAYKLGGVKDATIALMVATSISIMVTYAVERTLALAPLITGVVVMVMGGLTVALDDPVFIKIKPTLVNLLFAVILLGGAYGYKRGMLKYVLDVAFSLTDEGWLVLSRNVGSYGFGCACLTGSFDKARQVVMAVKHSKPLPLAKCYADKKLPKPE